MKNFYRYFSKRLLIKSMPATFDSFFGSAHVTNVPRIKIFRPCRERGGCYELDRVSCFNTLPDGNKTPAEQQGNRIQLGDVTQNPSAAQWREARYNGGRDPKSIFPNLQTRCHVGTFETDSSSQAKEGRSRTKSALLIQTDSEPVSNLVL